MNNRTPAEDLQARLEELRKAGAIGNFEVITLDDGQLLNVERGETSPEDLRGFLLTAFAGVINRVQVLS